MLLLDSLTLWASTVVEAEGALKARWSDAAGALERHPAAVLFVSEVVGMGVIPMDPLGRRFVDELGWLDQEVARLATEVYLMVAGLPVALKGAAATQRAL